MFTFVCKPFFKRLSKKKIKNEMLCIFRSVLKVNYLSILVSFPRKQIFLELEHLTNFNLYLRLKFSLLSFFYSTCHFSKFETKNKFFLQEQSENEFFKLTFYIEMFYLNTIVQLFLFVEQLDQLEVCLPFSLSLYSSLINSFADISICMVLDVNRFVMICKKRHDNKRYDHTWWWVTT